MVVNHADILFSSRLTHTQIVLLCAHISFGMHATLSILRLQKGGVSKTLLPLRKWLGKCACTEPSLRQTIPTKSSNSNL